MDQGSIIMTIYLDFIPNYIFFEAYMLIQIFYRVPISA